MSLVQDTVTEEIAKLGTTTGTGVTASVVNESHLVLKRFHWEIVIVKENTVHYKGDTIEQIVVSNKGKVVRFLKVLLT